MSSAWFADMRSKIEYQISTGIEEDLLGPTQIIATHVVHDDRGVAGLLRVADLILERTVVSTRESY